MHPNNEYLLKTQPLDLPEKSNSMNLRGRAINIVPQQIRFVYGLIWTSIKLQIIKYYVTDWWTFHEMILSSKLTLELT